MSLRFICYSLVACWVAGLTSAMPATDPPLQPFGKYGCGQHGPKNRACWRDNFDIFTDTSSKIPDTGKTRTYDLTITNVSSFSSADGVSKPAMLINGQFPGPTIVADWGDWVKINVHNQLQHNGTSIHWHGIWQKNTNDQDGANGVTECPIPPGASKTYLFRMHQYGTAWYHSHFSSQYGNGVVGTIQINGPASANYDVDLGPFSITDWYYETADRLERRAELVSNGPPPDSDNVLFNGTHVNAQGGGKYSRTTLQPGKKHRLRLINTSVDNAFTVSMASDTMSLLKRTKRWRTTGQRDAGKQQVLRHDAHQAARGHLQLCWRAEDKAANQPRHTCECSLQRHGGLQPGCQKRAPKKEFLKSQGYLDVNLKTPVIDDVAVFRWEVNGSSINVEWDRPILEYIREGDFDWPREANVIDIAQKNVWTFWVLQNLGPIPHPMHLHGHDFLVLGAGDGEFDRVAGVNSLNFDNPIRRDVAELPGGGHLVIAFQTDNPGAHLLHCHIAWHVSRGLSVMFLERKGDIPKTVNLANLEPNCKKWRAYEPTAVWPQSDSGL
ncbi:laccase-2 [Verticillium alfalfae VaMs.102]|uniref:laccase n=1 Tax=Verticillium alfalfae (strain VaMs.102 / ATCC MYA-4576 / FGSC 10136) TaxID=526221 RepID=C9S5U1_VERA1|nr:laccase-2 [Verticillium alfalfae VaMs.102]EEY14317.1 laccase-2 [Verticillium alfalfae VaMs.102]